MEARPLDPFGDFETAGYLRNVYRLKDQAVIRHLEAATYEETLGRAMQSLMRRPVMRYADVSDTHRTLFRAFYPWAGQDRSVNAREIAIGKAGYADLFAHPMDVQRAADHALGLGQTRAHMRDRPGEIFGLLAYAHPFLEGNGRVIMTVFSELCRRAEMHVLWSEIGTEVFLTELTRELQSPAGQMDRLLRPYVREKALPFQRRMSELVERFKKRTSG